MCKKISKQMVDVVDPDDGKEYYGVYLTTESLKKLNENLYKNLSKEIYKFTNQCPAVNFRDFTYAELLAKHLAEQRRKVN